EQVGGRFGPVVRDLVEGLTDPEGFAGLPLAERKRLQAERIRGLNDDVKRIKLCDQLSNVERVLARPPYDWSAEKRLTYVMGARQIVLECRGLWRSEEHTSELQSRENLVCRLLLEKKNEIDGEVMVVVDCM